jgi:hypothetical protein
MAHWIRSHARRMKPVVAGLAAFLALSMTAASAKDGPIVVDAEVVFAVDVSYSMDHEEQMLQRRGYADALTSEQFINALKAGVNGKIAIAYMQWASYRDQDIVLPWTLIDGPESAVEAADRLMNAPYRRAQRTSVSGAIDYSVRMFENNGFNGLRRVIDVSGDGPNNDGRPVQMARDDAVRQGITINGLPIVNIRPSWNRGDIPDLDIYYQDCVIGGDGAFMVVIRDRKSFADATRTKLIQEIAAAPRIGPDMPEIIPTQEREPRVNCMIGEVMWNRRWGN